MREVSGKAARTLLEALEQAAIPIAPLLAGLPFSAETVREPAARIDWDVFIALVDRIDALFGEAISIEELGTRMLRAPSFQFLRTASRLLVSPRQLYTLAERLVAPAMFANVTVIHEWLPTGRLIVNAQLAPGYRESKAFFRLCHGNVAALPRLLDLPPSTIEEEAVSGSRGRLILVPPRSHTLVAKLRRGARSVFAVGDAFRGFARHQAELEGSLAALRSSRHELRQLIERLPEGVLIHRGGVVIWANATALESLGYARCEEVVGRHLLGFVPAEDHAALATAMAAARPNEVSDDRIEYRVLRPDGMIRRLQAGTVQHVEFEGAPARLVVLRDVTEQHRLHDELALAERMALLGRLAANVAHELNNPLAYAHTSIEVASRELARLDEPARTQKIEASLARARDGTERVRGIVRDLKMLSRAEDEPSEAVDLPEVLDSTLVLVTNAIVQKAKLVRRYGPAPHARASRGRLGQLFLNLLLNAADAIPDGDPEGHEIAVAISRDAAGRAVVEISDTGNGIDAAVAARVFDPFFTTKAVGAGTGLGLAICHRIVTELGGEIAFDSTPGRGTTFRVALPATDHEPATPLRPRERVRGRLLVVDDEPELLRSIGELLGEEHDVVTVASGRQALELLRVDRAFDVILADLMMPGVSGRELFDTVRAEAPDLAPRFVFMTGGTFATRNRTPLGTAPNRCIEKPFDGDELLRVIGEVIGERAG